MGTGMHIYAPCITLAPCFLGVGTTLEHFHKQFLKAVKYLNEGSSSIPVLAHKNVIHDSDEAC